jgi:homoserine kinase
VTSDIPMAAGLGSSAAASVAGIRVFERVTQATSTGPMPEGVLLAAATEVEGHADNAAPALFGGLTSVLEAEDGDPVALRWTWPPDLKLIVSTPAIGLATAKARAALAPEIARKDAIFNLQRVLSLVHALQEGNVERLRESVKDRWHQPARAALVPLLDQALTVDDPDVLGAFLSGAGPSIAWLVRGDAPRVVRLVQGLYDRAGVAVTVRTLNVHEAHGDRAPYQTPAVAAAHGRTA